MINTILGWFGYKLAYTCDWGTYRYRYDSIDYNMGRPVHKDMGIAPPWAKMIIVPKARPVI